MIFANNCGVCKSPAANPVRSGCCQQVVCWECFVQKDNCSICYGKANPETAEAEPIEAADAIYACANGCNMWFKTNETLGLHLSFCPKRPAWCANGGVNCGKLTVAGLADHAAVCRFLPISCPDNCGATVPAMKIQEHRMNECVLAAVLCPHCGISLQRSDMGRHIQEDCSELVVICKYAPWGCDHSSPRRLMHIHIRENTEQHLAILESKVAQQSLQLAKINREQNSLPVALQQVVKLSQQKLEDLPVAAHLQQKAQECWDQVTKAQLLKWMIMLCFWWVLPWVVQVVLFSIGLRRVWKSVWRPAMEAASQQVPVCKKRCVRVGYRMGFFILIVVLAKVMF